MMLRKAVVLSAFLSPLALFAQGCQSGGVGDPCIPEDEYLSNFGGFAVTEVNIESRSFQCETRVCLVNHFRGRVTCPIGQSEENAARIDDLVARETSLSADEKAELEKLRTAPDTCRIPGSTGKNADMVRARVFGQCSKRPDKLAVYCSCRCDGPEKDAKYCECPNGFSCKPFKELDVGALVAKGSAQLGGSYCVKDEDKGYFPDQCSAASGSVLNECTAANGACNVKANPLAPRRERPRTEGARGRAGRHRPPGGEGVRGAGHERAARRARAGHRRARGPAARRRRGADARARRVRVGVRVGEPREARAPAGRDRAAVADVLR